MSDTSLPRALAFNQELTALSRTGLPLDIGITGGSDRIAGKLDKINSVLATRLGRGQTLEQAIAEEPQLPAKYRAALLAWLRCDDPTVVLDAVSKPAEARQQFGHHLGSMMVYPLIVLSLAYIAFLYLCSVTAPKIEAIYAQLWQQPSHSVSILATARNLMPIWGPLVPLLLVLAWLWWRSRAPRLLWTWVPGSSRYFAALQNANLAQQLVMLLESGYSLDESLALIGPLSSGDGIAPAAAGMANVERELRPADKHPTAWMPPLLRWAVTGDLGGEPLPQVLRFVAGTYRQTAHRQQKIWRVVAPTICGVLLGGMFVLGYGLSLFLPMVQLLKDISLPGGA